MEARRQGNTASTPPCWGQRRRRREFRTFTSTQRLKRQSVTGSPGATPVRRSCPAEAWSQLRPIKTPDFHPHLTVMGQRSPAETEDLIKIQNLLIPKMSRFQSKIIHHSGNQENLDMNERRQSTDANTKMTDILELPNKNFKAAFI